MNRLPGFLESYKDTLPEAERIRAEAIFSTVLSFAKASYQGIMVIDLIKKTVPFQIASPMLFDKELSGMRPLKIDYDYYRKYMPLEELPLLAEIIYAGRDFRSHIPAEEYTQWSYSFDFHIKFNRAPILHNHKIIPLTLNPEGQLWLVLAITSISCEDKAGNLRMAKDGESFYYEYSIENKVWKKKDKIILTTSEKYIIFLSAAGKSINEVAKALNISADAIKKARQRLFLKLNVNNMSEAITLASLNNFI